MRIGHFLLGSIVIGLLLIASTHGLVTALLGGVIAVLIGMIAELRNRVENLQLDLDQIRALSFQTRPERVASPAAAKPDYASTGQYQTPASAPSKPANPWEPTKPTAPVATGFEPTFEPNVPINANVPINVSKETGADSGTDTGAGESTKASPAQTPAVTSKWSVESDTPPVFIPPPAPVYQPSEPPIFEPKVIRKGGEAVWQLPNKNPPAPVFASTPAWQAANKPDIENSSSDRRSGNHQPAARSAWQPDPTPSWLSNLLSMENWPIKAGVLLLLVALGSAFKYLVQHGYFDVSIETGLSLVAACCVGLLVFAYRSTDTRRAFGLSLQGGALGGLLVTIYAALRLYHVLQPSTAFFLMLVVVLAGVFLAIVFDSIWLAGFAAASGFAAPILASSGSGAFVQLFAYYLVLNVGILALAYKKAWRALNIIGAVATFGIGLIWGANYYVPQNFSSVQPFLSIFFLMYLVIPILYTLRHGKGEVVLDGVLIFGVPLAALTAQAGLLRGNPEALGMVSFVVAVIYALLAWLLSNKPKFDSAGAELLQACFTILAFGFFTLALPLYFSASVTSALWAVEGAAIIWLGLKQNRYLPQVIGLALQLLAAVAYVGGFTNATDTPALFNGQVLGALWIALSGLATSYLFDRKQQTAISALTMAWGMLWWTLTCGIHIMQITTPDQRFAAVILALALTQTLSALAARALRWPNIAWVALLGVGLLPVLAYANHVRVDDSAVQTLVQGYFGNQVGLALLVYLASAFVCLYQWRTPDSEEQPSMPTGLPLAHSSFIAGIALLAGLLGLHQTSLKSFGDGVQIASFVWPFIALTALLIARFDGIAWPLQKQFASYRDDLAGLAAALLGIGALGMSVMTGRTTPLPYLPLINPLELTIIAIVGLLIWRNKSSEQPTDLSTWYGIFGLWLITMSSLRLTANWLEPELAQHSFALGAAFFSKTGQAALSIVWSIVGCGAMLLGNAKRKRQLWMIGASLMGVVLGKLLLVDRHNLGDVTGIVAMFVVGGLLAVVGYFAPMRTEE